MQSPPSWPFLLRYDDGYIIYTEEDLARHPQDGPFRHIRLLEQYNPNLRIQAVYAEGFLQVDGMERFPGEVFFLHGTLDEWDLRQTGAIKTLPPTDHPRRHQPSGRTFRDEPSYFAFVRRYERRDLSGIVWTMPVPADTPSPSSLPERVPGRPAHEQCAPAAHPTNPTQSSYAKKSGGNRISERELDRFEKELKETVWEYMDVYKDEAIPKLERIRHNFPRDYSEAKWRLRYERVRKKRCCKNWSDTFASIMESREASKKEEGL